MGNRQIALYTILYYSKSSFSQVKWLKIGKVVLKNGAVEIRFPKQRRCFIHPYSSQNIGKFCPVNLIAHYLSLCSKLGHNSSKNYLFPKVLAKFENILSTHNVLFEPHQTPMLFRDFEERFKRHIMGMSSRNITILPSGSLLYPLRKGR